MITNIFDPTVYVTESFLLCKTKLVNNKENFTVKIRIWIRTSTLL